MIVRIDTPLFFAAWNAIIPQPWDPEDLPDDELFYTECIRVEASGGMFRLRGPFGNAECPAEVERPGVLFVPINEFVGATRNLVNEPVVEFEITHDWIRVNFKRFLTPPEDFFLFEDVADAPESRDDFEVVVEEEDADLFQD